MGLDELDREWIKKHIAKMRPQMNGVFNPNEDCMTLTEIMERLEFNLKLLERWRENHPECGDT